MFDVDGVLLDSMASYRRAWARWAAIRHVDEGAVMAVASGRRPVDIIGAVAPHLNADEEAIRFRGILSSTEVDEPVIAGAVALVRQLPARAWAVVTSGERRHVMPRLARAGFPRPPAAVCAEDVTAGKPDPSCYLLAARRLEVYPARCVVVEDAPVGVTAAKLAGMGAVALCTTHVRQQLKAADAIFAGLIDAAPFLLALAGVPGPTSRS